MLRRDYRDVVGGGLLTACGLWMVLHASSRLGMGTVTSMGPGFFPTIIGVALAGFGLLIMIPAFFREGVVPQIEFRSAAAVFASIAAFALVILPFGLIPAIAALVIVASLAETTFRPVAIVASILVLSLGSYLIFSVGLGLPLTMVRY